MIPSRNCSFLLVIHEKKYENRFLSSFRQQNHSFPKSGVFGGRKKKFKPKTGPFQGYCWLIFFCMLQNGQNFEVNMKYDFHSQNKE